MTLLAETSRYGEPQTSSAGAFPYEDGAAEATLRQNLAFQAEKVA
jgi:hypothetical protein